MRFTAHVGERGRLVLPAALRRALELDEGSHVVLELDGDTVRLMKAADVAQAARGIFRSRPDRDLVDELLVERRDEAAREAGGTLSGR